MKPVPRSFESLRWKQVGCAFLMVLAAGLILSACQGKMLNTTNIGQTIQPTARIALVNNGPQAGILLVAFLLRGCAVYPAFQNPIVDYNGRWGEVGDGAVATNPYEYEESLRTMDQWTDGAYGSAYGDRNQLAP